MNYERLSVDANPLEDDAVEFIEVVTPGHDGAEHISTDYKDTTLRALGAFSMPGVVRRVE